MLPLPLFKLLIIPATFYPDSLTDIRNQNLYTLVLGIGQLAVAWELIPTPVEASPEDSPQVVSVTSSSKGKTREARRFTHVLSNLIAKNFKGPGPHGIPKEAVKDVKGEDVMVAEMIAAMADKSEILDFADTKPYKDHWKNMHKPEFRRLARTLFVRALSVIRNPNIMRSTSNK